MVKMAILREAKDVKLGDTVYRRTVAGPEFLTIVLIRHSPGSVRYAFNLSDNSYFTLDEGDSATIVVDVD